MKLKPVPKLILFLTIVGGFVYGFRQAVYSGIIPRPNVLKSVIPVKAEDITAQVLTHDTSNVKLAVMPTTSASQPCMDGNTRNCLNGAIHEGEIWAWNGNGGLIFAVGGAAGPGGKGIQTSRGSLMEKYGVNVRLIRQDDTNQMKQDMISTATRLKSDPNASGIKFITIMGDQGGATLADMEKACPTCDFEVMATIGYSRGEDSVWSTPEIKANPQKARGALWIAVVREGDWNIGMKWAGQNSVPNNPDDTVYDPDALNWVNAESYTKAVEMLIQPGGFCVDLPVKGKVGGGKQHVCANGVATWTPGDVTLAKKKGGYVPIMTTKEVPFMMPTTMIGIKSWNASHRDEIVRFLAAIYEAGDNIHANPAALQKMGEVSAKLYNEENAEYWVKYYKGVVEPDAQGIRVPLGGSTVMNLADALQSFGLNGGPNLFAATYTTFGKIVTQQYPKLYPSVPSLDKVLNTSYVAGVKALGTLSTSNAEKVITTESSAPMKSIEGKRNYSINFAVGSAEILSSSFATLNQLADDILITKYAVAAHGHTDNTGTPDGNMTLSEARANSVAAYLKRKGVTNVIRVYPHGQEEPIADNATAAGKAANRRVQIVLGTID